MAAADWDSHMVGNANCCVRPQQMLNYALLLLYLPDFLLCIFYCMAGMHVVTLWTSSGQHKDTSNSRATTKLIVANSLRSCFQQTAPCGRTLDQC